MPQVFGYGRHSTDKQGLTEEAQRLKVESYISTSLPELSYAGWVYDTAVSGKKPLFERPEGRNLLALAQPGDHLVWAKLDRAFRSVVDGASTLAMLAHKGVYVHSLDLGLDTSTAVGRCVCTVMLAFAELEREYASERTREALSAKHRAGLPCGRGVPIGWKILDRIGLPHTVKFQNDLSVSIEELGRELDFDNLSRGERNRLILSLSWAFRDVWESLYQPINLLFIDEVIDTGMDSSGVENSLAILKKMSREGNRSVWLVSHKDELAGRVNNVLNVVKENGFTTYNTDVEIS